MLTLKGLHGPNRASACGRPGRCGPGLPGMAYFNLKFASVLEPSSVVTVTW